MKKNVTILVVEDDPDDRFFVERIFKRASSPARLEFAHDGEDAIAYLSGTGAYQDRALHPLPNLILLDLKMPKVSGIEVLEWLKTQPRLKCIPVTILSSSSLQSDVTCAYELGANAYFVKPLTFDKLEEVFNKAREFFTEYAEVPEL